MNDGHVIVWGVIVIWGIGILITLAIEAAKMIQALIEWSNESIPHDKRYAPPPSSLKE